MCSFGIPSNVSEIDGRLSGNTREEADALMILHAIDLAHSSPFWHVRIISPDTDVRLLFMHYYSQLLVLI